MTKEPPNIPPPKQSQSTEHGFRKPCDSHFFVRWFHIHSFRHLITSFRKPISKGDFFDLRPQQQLDNNYANFIKKEKWIPKKSRTISQALVKTYWREFVFGALLGIVASVLAMGTPYLTKKVLKFIEHDHTTHEDLHHARQYITLWIFIYIFKVFIHQYAQRLIFMVGLKVEQVLFVKLLNKIPKIPFSYKIHTSKTEMLNLFMIEIKLVVYFFKYASILFTAPTTLLVSGILIFMEGKAYGYLLLYVLLTAGAIGIVLDRHMSECRSNKFHIEEQRINTNLELTGQMRVLKQMGWEKLIPLKTSQYRHQENHYNHRYYIFAHIHDLVLVLVPLVVVAAIFLIQFGMDKREHALTVAEVYTILYYVGMTYYPMKNMRSLVVSYYDMVSALGKLQEFLRIDEVANLKLVDKQQPKGEMHLQNVILSEQPKVRPAEIVSGHKLSVVHKSFSKSILEIDKMTVRIPFSIKLQKGEKLVIVNSEGEGSVLLSALIGSCSIKSGKCEYGGKVGYVPLEPWFQKSSIVDNITFGSRQDRALLRKVYNIVALTEEIEQFPQKQFSMISDSNAFTDSQLKRIALARALYTQSDLYFLDDIFKSMDPKIIDTVYSNIRQYLHDQTVVITSNTANFINPKDKVLVFVEGQAVEYDTLQNLTSNPNSQIHKYMDTQGYALSIEQILKQKQIIEQQVKRRKQKLARRKAKLRAFVKSIVRFARVTGHHVDIQQLTKEEIKKHGGADDHHQNDHHNDSHHGDSHGHHEIDGNLREPGVSKAQYMRFLFSSENKSFLLILGILIIVTQTLKVFLNWWIGHISHHHGKYKHKEEEENILIYIEVTVLFGVLAAVEGVLSASLSRKSAENLSQKTMQSLAGSELHFFETHDTVVINNKVNKDFEQIFQIHYYSQDILRNIFVFIFTLFLTALESPGFMIMGILIVTINTGILHFFMRTERQIMRYYTPFTDTLYTSLEAVIGGIDTAKVMGKKKQFIDKEMDNIYNISVLKLNQRYIYHAMTILCELSTLVLIAWPAYYAVNNKQNMRHSDLSLTATVIAYSLKLTGLLTTIMKEFVIVESGMRFNILKSFYVQDLPQELKYSKPVEKRWLREKPSIQIEKVSASTEGNTHPLIHEMTLEIEPAQKIALLGKSSSGLNAIKPLLERSTVPIKNVDNTLGVVRVGGVDLNSVGRKYIAEQIQGLPVTPLVFTSSVLQNIDPFGQYRERDIMKVVQKLHLEDELELIRKAAKKQPTRPKQHHKDIVQIKKTQSRYSTESKKVPSKDSTAAAQNNISHKHKTAHASATHHHSEDAHHPNSLARQPVNNKLLLTKISQADTKLKVRNSISLARVLLHRPSVLIVESTEPNTYDGDVSELLERELPETTILYLNSNLRHSLQLQKVGVISHGMLAEWDSPFQLLKNPDSLYSRLLQVSEPAIFAFARKKSRITCQQMDEYLKSSSKRQSTK